MKSHHHHHPSLSTPLSTAVVITLIITLVQLPVTLVYATTTKNAITQGNDYFQAQCLAQTALLRPLLTAVTAGDLTAARTAYINARPPYEQIEVLANVFPLIDRAIDARPYVFPNGEDARAWRGFHLIERSIFRDRQLGTFVRDAVDRLVQDVDTLCSVLAKTHRFTPRKIFQGSLALAFEVPAKKISSEEETWSDLSLMIFRNNYRGIWSQVRPFFDTQQVSDATADAATRAYQTIVALMNRVDPEHPFDTDLGDARPYSNVTYPERKLIIDAAYDFALALESVAEEALADATEEDVEEEEEEEEEESDPEMTIPSDLYLDQTRAGLAYFLRQCIRQQQVLVPLRRSLDAGDIAAARAAYPEAREPYEQIETLAGDFSMIDLFLDGRPYAYERGERDEAWRGFHEIERDLYRDDDVVGAAAAAARVTEDVDALCKVLQAGVDGDADTTFSAENSFAGMITLAYEVPAKKISSEEETWSDLSVMIFRENLKGIWSQFEPFKDVLPTQISNAVEAPYQAIRNLITFIVDRGNDFDGGSDFMPYSKVFISERKQISDLFYMLARALVDAKKTLAAQ